MRPWFWVFHSTTPIRSSLTFSILCPHLLSLNTLSPSPDPNPNPRSMLSSKPSAFNASCRTSKQPPRRNCPSSSSLKKRKTLDSNGPGQNPNNGNIQNSDYSLVDGTLSLDGPREESDSKPLENPKVLIMGLDQGHQKEDSESDLTAAFDHRGWEHY